MQPFDILPKLLIVPDAFLLIILMPGPHIEMKLMQRFEDVGSCELWQGSCWEGCH